MFSFSAEKKLKNSRARAGVIKTPHGNIETPAFIQVATRATVKTLTPDQLRELGTQAVLGNTYHLYLRPGEDIVAKGGGLSEFMSWHGPTFTDSGGFQVFSLGAAYKRGISKFTAVDVHDDIDTSKPTIFDEDLATSHGKLAIIDEEGVTFTSHVDGSLHRFTAERSIEIQHKLGADIIFAFDECTAPTEGREYQKEAMDRTHRWAKRSLVAHRQNTSSTQALFGIGQGGPFDDLRRQSAKEIGEMGFDGFGLGGSFSRKYGENSLQSALAVLSELPEGMPVHGLGVGEPEDLFLAAEWGVDTFDCVAPTRLARNGTMYTKDGTLGIKNEEYKEDFSPIENGCACYTCKNFTRGYVCYLQRVGEYLGGELASIHNEYFIVNLVENIRQSILDGNFSKFKEKFLKQYYK